MRAEHRRFLPAAHQSAALVVMTTPEPGDAHHIANRIMLVRPGPRIG